MVVEDPRLLLKLIDAVPDSKRPAIASTLYARAQSRFNDTIRGNCISGLLRNRVPGSVNLAREFVKDPTNALIRSLIRSLIWGASVSLTEEQLLSLVLPALHRRRASGSRAKMIMRVLGRQGGDAARGALAELSRSHPDPEIRSLADETRARKW